MAEYQAKKGTTALGIIGTSLGGLAVANQGALGNLIGGVLGGGTQNSGAAEAATAIAAMTAMAATAAGSRNGVCSEDHCVDRYTLGLESKIAELESKIALRDANTYGDQKLLEVYKHFDGRFRDVEGEIARQAVRNQRTEDGFALAAQERECLKQEIKGDIAREAEKRCCADNSIVNYTNATFYPKQTADVTTGTTTTSAKIYNPLPDCSGGWCYN